MKLTEFFAENRKVALAFSGGVDSSYLLYAALQNSADVCSYYVKTAFQPNFEFDRAKKFAEELGAKLEIIEADIFQFQNIVCNASDRCYHCKKMILSQILERAQRAGYETIIDGTNASDSTQERPGMKALQEFRVRSPLREAGLSKEAIRQLSKEAGLSTWNLPSYSCLATRVKSGIEISRDLLEQIANAEKELFSLGYSNFRVRTDGEFAFLIFSKEQLEKAFEQKALLLSITGKFFRHVEIDREGR